MSRTKIKPCLFLYCILYLGCGSKLKLISCEQEVTPRNGDDEDDVLISQLLEVPIHNAPENSDVARILKLLEGLRNCNIHMYIVCSL